MPTVRGHVPIRPHLLRYVQWRENLAMGEPLILPGFTAISSALDLILINKGGFLAAAESGRRKEVGLSACTAAMPYEVSGSRFSHNYIFVTDTAALAFNTFLNNLMNEDLLHRVALGQSAGLYERDVIIDFLRDTTVDDFLDHEALKKAQWRLRRYRGYIAKRGRPVRGTVFK